VIQTLPSHSRKREERERERAAPCCLRLTPAAASAVARSRSASKPPSPPLVNFLEPFEHLLPPPSLLRWLSPRPPPTMLRHALRSRPLPPTPVSTRCGIWRTSSPSSAACRGVRWCAVEERGEAAHRLGPPRTGRGRGGRGRGRAQGRQQGGGGTRS
jgi:hypothetical protein